MTDSAEQGFPQHASRLGFLIQTDAPETLNDAVRLLNAALARGHSRVFAFFSHDGARVAVESRLARGWLDAALGAQGRLDLIVCPAALERRGFDPGSVCEGISTAGLGQFALRSEHCSRLLSFGA